MSKVLLLTPPFTQLNTPYPATAYLKGYLNSVSIKSAQVDLGIEVIDLLFSEDGLKDMFAMIEGGLSLSDNSKRIYHLKDTYIACINRVVDFLRLPTVLEAQSICNSNMLPKASRFNNVDELDWAFGTMGLIDKAKHYCTLFLEDLSDFITEAVDPDFGFSRYAERLGRSADTFDELAIKLQQQLSFIDKLLVKVLKAKVEKEKPNLVAVSVPFPGNLLGALRVGQWVKAKYPGIKILFGGGFVNTELRSLSDVRVFGFADFIILDDGEAPLLHVIEYIDGKRNQDKLKRTFVLKDGTVTYINGSDDSDITQDEVGTPDYSDIAWEKYISVVEVANPMFRLWSDGAWVKLTLAHGCYWGKCTFCDGSLDYISRFDANKAVTIVDRMEELIRQTGKRGFHFVDEAAPPALLKELSLEIIRRGLQVSWWTNIRFEKSFTADVCRLLKQSGCIAVSGGLEVASDRILKLINKGVDVGQVANVATNFKNAGIMVHAYLMYGFPSQTAQETVDSLEVVRQLFELGIIESGFWHQFALTAHSPVGLNPDKFGVKITGGLNGLFANNDLQYIDSSGAIHESFGDGLKKALYNYMHGICFDYDLSEWFDFKIPRTSLPPNYIERRINEESIIKEHQQIVWLGKAPLISFFSKKKQKKQVEMAELILISANNNILLNVKKELGIWLYDILEKLMPGSEITWTVEDFEDDYNNHQLGDFSVFINSYTFKQLREAGLLII